MIAWIRRKEDTLVPDFVREIEYHARIFIGVEVLAKPGLIRGCGIHYLMLRREG
jgi:hypothetical protein